MTSSLVPPLPLLSTPPPSISTITKLLYPSSISAVHLFPLTSSISFPRRLLRSPTSSIIGFGSPKPSFPFVVRSSSVSTTAVAKTIAVGDKLLDATLSYFDSTDKLQTITVIDLTKGKKAILFAVPGAFTPTYSQKHLPGFIDKAKDLKAKGVDVITCVSVNDAFIVKAWKENLNILGDDILLLSDGNREFTRKLGMELDLRDKPVGLRVRSRRYTLLAEDGVVKVLNLEEGGAFTTSSTDDILSVL